MSWHPVRLVIELAAADIGNGVEENPCAVWNIRLRRSKEMAICFPGLHPRAECSGAAP